MKRIGLTLAILILATGIAFAGPPVYGGPGVPYSWPSTVCGDDKALVGSSGNMACTASALGSAAFTASTAYDAAGTAAGKIASSISDSDTTHCPDGNSVFDALAGKSSLAGSSSIVTVGTVTSGNVDAVVSASNTTTAGKIETCTDAETTTGTSTTCATTPSNIKAGVPWAVTTHAATESATAATMYGGFHVVTGAYTVSIPTIVVGMYADFMASTAAVMCIDVTTGTDILILNGQPLTAGNKACTDGTINNQLRLKCPIAGKCTVNSVVGLAVDGGA